MAKRKTAPSSAPAAATHSTRQTRQTRQSGAAVTSSSRENNSSQGTESPASRSLGQDAIPRRFAPRAKRGESVITAASPATEDFAKSSYEDRSSVSKRQGLPTVSEPGEKASEGEGEPQAEETNDEGDPGLDPEMVEFFLPGLSRSSDKLYELIQADNAPASLALVEDSFFTARHAFTSEQNFFISNERRDQALAQIKQASQLDDARSAIYSANVVALLRLLMKIQKGEMALRPVLVDLVLDFPQVFEPRTDSTHEDDEKILDLAFGIRCCCLVDRIRTPRSSRPLLLAAEVFCGETVKSTEEAKGLLLDGSNHVVPGVNEDFAKEYFAERMERLYPHLAQNSKAKVTEALEKEFDLGNLLSDLNEWAQTVFEDLQEGPIVRRPREGDPSALEIDYTMDANTRSRAPPSGQQVRRDFPAMNQRKRPLATANEDGEDELFTRLTASSPIKRTRFSHRDFASSADRAASIVVPQSQAEPADDELHPADVPALSQSAKANARKAKPSSGPQRRTFWSDDDVVKLIRAIAEHECAWSTIEREVSFSVERNQQAIRDKARNLKVDFLKADSILPAGFDGVALGKKERDLVIKCRRNPDRMEADVRDGRVINEIYLPPEVEAEYEAQVEREVEAEEMEGNDVQDGADAAAEVEGEEDYHDAHT